MCRLYGFLSNEPTKVDCSLVYSQNSLMLQSRIDHIGRDHTDGWGIATYRDGVPHIEKQITAAYQCQMFSAAAEKTYSTAMLAHVRRATVGRNSILNTHPFASDKWTFAHNGEVTGFEGVRQQLERETESSLQTERKGETDSEQFFLWLLTRLKSRGISSLRENVASQAAERVAECLTELARRCTEAAPELQPRLNFVLTDGIGMLACRWNNSLYMLERRGIYECEICGIPHIHHHETADHRAVALASEPVTHEDWQEVDNHSVLQVNMQMPIKVLTA